MKRTILLFVLVVFAAGAALAHGKEEHLKPSRHPCRKNQRQTCGE
jgi:hypothetical protein